MPSLRDYFAQRIAPEETAAPAAPSFAEQNAADDAQRQAEARAAFAQANPFTAGLRQGVSSIGDSLTAAKGLGEAALGYEQPAVATLRRAQQQMQDTAQYTPDNAGSLTDAYKTGNLGTYAQYKLGSLLPGVVATVAPAIVTGGVGGLAQAGLRRVALGEAADALASRVVARQGAASILERAGVKAAIPGEADRLATSTVKQQFINRALAQNPSNLGAQVGEAVGAGAAGAVQAAPSQVDNVLNDPGDGSTLQQRALKGVGATAIQGAINALPNIALMNRYGLGAAATKAIESRLSAPLLKRLAREGAEQGAIGAGSAALSVAADRATHEWITGSPAASAALPDYINAIADGALGGAVFGAPAGFRGNRGAATRLREATGKLRDDLAARVAKADRPKPGEPVNPDGTRVEPNPAASRFDENLNALRNDDDSHYNDLLKGVEAYNTQDNGDGTQTLNGPFSSLIDPARMAALSRYTKMTPTERAFGSMLDDGRITTERMLQVRAASKAFTKGFDQLAPIEKSRLASFVDEHVAPEKRGKLLTALATANETMKKGGADLRKPFMTDSEGNTITETDPFTGKTSKVPTDDAGAPPQFKGATADGEAALGLLPEKEWTAAQFRKSAKGPQRGSPDEENVRMVRTSQSGDDYNVDLNVMRAASAIAASPEGKAQLASGAGSRNLRALSAVLTEARLRDQHIPASEIRPGLRVFPGEGGLLSPADARALRESFGRATKKAAVERANPVAMADAQTGPEPFNIAVKNPPRAKPLHAPATEFDAQGKRTLPKGPLVPEESQTPRTERITTAKPGAKGTRRDSTTDRTPEMTGDLQGVSERSANPLGAKDINLSGERQIENTARRAARALSDRSAPSGETPAQKATRYTALAKKTTGQLYEDALHVKDSAHSAAIKSAARQLSEDDPVLARHMEQADQRKAVSDFAGERITGDEGALIPWLKGAVAGKKPTRAQREAFAALKERTDNFAGMSDKAKSYARDLIAKLPAKEKAKAAVPNTREELASNLSNAELKKRLANKAIDPAYKKVLEAERDARGTKFDETVPAKKETVGTINKEITDADQYARNPPKDFTTEQAAKLEARMREVSDRAKARRDALGEDHEHFQTFDDIRMNAKDAADALKEVISNEAAARAAHPEWYDKNVPVAEQPGPKGGSLRESIDAIKKLPQWKTLNASIKLLAAHQRTKRDAFNETRLANALSKMFGVSKLTLRYVDNPSRNGEYSYSAKTIYLSNHLTGAARMSTLLHEFGHHIVSEKFSNASPEMKAALIKDYQTWRRSQGAKADGFDARASRAPLFSSLRMLDELGPRGTKSLDQLTAKQAKYMLSAHEYFADSIARALEQHEPAKTLVGKFFANVAKVTKLAYDLVRGHDPRLTDTPSAVRDWVQSLYEAAQEPAPAAASAANASPATAAGAAPHSSFTSPTDVTSVLPAAERGVLADVFTRRGMMEQLLTGADRDTANKLGSVDTQLSTAIDRGFALWASGQLKFVDRRALAPLHAMRDAIMKIFGIPTKDDLARRILADLKAGNVNASYSARRIAENEVRANLRAQVNAGSQLAATRLAARKAVAGTSRLVTSKLQPVYDKVLVDLDKRVRDTHNPSLVKLAAIVHLQTGERSSTDSVPMTQAIKQTQAKFWDRAAKLGEGLSLRDQAKVLKALRTRTTLPDAKLDAARQAILTHFKSMKGYMDSAGVKMGDIEDYFPVVVDPRKVQNRAEAFKAMLSEPQLEAGMRKYFKNKGWDVKGMTQLDMIDAMYRMAASEFDYSLGGQSFANGMAPGGKEFRTRVSEFIYQTKDPVLINQFAKFQSGNLDQVMMPYVTHAVRRAEFTRRLGTKDAEGQTALENLLTKAKEQGATPEDLQLAKDFVDASLGSYGTGPNPFFQKVLGSFDRVFDTKLSDVNSAQYRKVSNALIAYQNVRVLGLGLFGNMIDPLGVWTRSSSASQTWKGYKAAYKALGKANPSYLRDMAHALGTVERHATSEALAYNYGGTGDDLNSISNRINRTLFRVNGMETITNFARLAATETGNKFLLQHATNPTKHSARYLEELGLKPSDIKEDPQHPGYVARSAKIDAALYRFVDESVLRPVATQRPLWHNDPHFAVAAQYKGYLYSFYNTITARMLHEAKNGNIQGLAPIAGYLAVSMAAELAREMVQFGGDGNPNRKDWDGADYMLLAANRSGLAGPRFGVAADSLGDVERGNLPGQSIAGPTVSQASGLAKMVRGRQSVESTAVQALPGQSIYRGYLRDDTDNESRAEVQPGQGRAVAGT